MTSNPFASAPGRCLAASIANRRASSASRPIWLCAALRSPGALRLLESHDGLVPVRLGTSLRDEQLACSPSELRASGTLVNGEAKTAGERDEDQRGKTRRERAVAAHPLAEFRDRTGLVGVHDSPLEEGAKIPAE